MQSIFLSVIIPCYNEEENLKKGVLKEVYDFLNKKNINWEVIVSDDGSTDNSKNLVKSQIKNLPGFMLLENPHGGKPSALQYGINTSKGKFILFSDMDQSTPIGELNKLLPYTDKEFNVVIGSRGLVRKNFPFYRKMGAIVFMSFRRLMILPEINDTQCGFKLFLGKALKENFSKLEFFKKEEKTKGWKVTSYDVELLHILKKRGYKIKEVAVLWKDRDMSKSKGGGLEKYVKESHEMLTQILRVKMNDIKGMYV